MDVSLVGGGIVEVNQTAPSSYPATFTFTNGASVRLEAIPAPGYYFTNWSGDLSVTTNPITITIDCNKKTTANFSQIMHTLTIHVNGSGSTSPTAGKHSYPDGTIVSITATPDSGWQFDSWTGDIAELDVTTTILTMDSNKTVAASFSQVKPSWWLTTGIIAGLIIIGVIIWLLVKSRTT